LRRCLLDPIPELQLSVKLLDAAADAFLLKKTRLASKLIKQSDMSVIMDYAKRLVGALSIEVHRQTTRPKTLPIIERDPNRMPKQSIQRSIFERDGWRCRFCGIKVISREARKKIVEYFPKETHWGNKEFGRHPTLYLLSVSLDHVLPHSRGGKNDEANFVTACYGCQFGRGEWTIEESELLDPREFHPIVDDWDGLTRIEGFIP